MPYCNKCGAQLRGDENNCPQCGSQVHFANANFQQNQNMNAMYSNAGSMAAPYIQDSGSVGWGILAAFIPVTGLVLYIIWRNTRPRCAKVVGIGTIVGVVIALLSGAIFTASMSTLFNELMYYM